MDSDHQEFQLNDHGASNSTPLRDRENQTSTKDERVKKRRTNKQLSQGPASQRKCYDVLGSVLDGVPHPGALPLQSHGVSAIPAALPLQRETSNNTRDLKQSEKVEQPKKCKERKFKGDLHLEISEQKNVPAILTSSPKPAMNTATQLLSLIKDRFAREPTPPQPDVTKLFRYATPSASQMAKVNRGLMRKRKPPKSTPASPASKLFPGEIEGQSRASQMKPPLATKEGIMIGAGEKDNKLWTVKRSTPNTPTASCSTGADLEIEQTDKQRDGAICEITESGNHLCTSEAARLLDSTHVNSSKARDAPTIDIEYWRMSLKAPQRK